MTILSGHFLSNVAFYIVLWISQINLSGDYANLQLTIGEIANYIRTEVININE